MKKTRRSSRFLRTVLFAVVLLGLGAVFFGNGRQWIARKQQEKGMQELEEEIRRLEEERQTTEELLHALRSPTFIEREARERLGYKKPGETTVIFPNSADTRQEEKNGGGDFGPYFSEWVEYFFGQKKQARD